MDSITLGRTELTVNKTGFGVLPIQRVPMDQAVKLLRKAYDNGIDFYDTARGYTDSEEKIGNALSEVRRNIVIASKTMSKTPEVFWEHLATSLRLLQTDYIDIYQFHNPKSCYAPDDGSGMYEAMLEAKRQGKIRFIGITSHRPDVARKAVESGLYDTLQYPFSYLSSEDEIALVKLCGKMNIGFIAMKALSGGLITNAAAASAFINQYPNVLPIWGIQRECELDEFISYMESPPLMTDALLADIESDRAQLTGGFCRACGYCMPCPAGISISQCARMSLLARRAPKSAYLTAAAKDMMRQIEHCTNCGACAKKCPYGLDTPALLRENYNDYMENFMELPTYT